jgi:hypothetical protein
MRFVVVASAALLAGSAAVFAVSAPASAAKDDPAAAKAAREAVRKKYKDAKKYPFADLSYYLDTTKMKETRWEVHDTSEPSGVDDPHPMFSATLPSGNASDPTALVDINVWRSPHWKMEGGKKSVFSHEFKAAGKTAQVSNVKEMAAGHFEDFMKSCKEPLKDKSSAPEKKQTGPAEWWGWAVGTVDDKDDPWNGKRARRDWFLWAQPSTAPPYTWLIQVTTSEKVYDKPEFVEKIVELVKNVTELKDPALK